MAHRGRHFTDSCSIRRCKPCGELLDKGQRPLASVLPRYRQACGGGLRRGPSWQAEGRNRCYLPRNWTSSAGAIMMFATSIISGLTALRSSCGRSPSGEESQPRGGPPTGFPSKGNHAAPWYPTLRCGTESAAGGSEGFLVARCDRAIFAARAKTAAAQMLTIRSLCLWLAFGAESREDWSETEELVPSVSLTLFRRPKRKAILCVRSQTRESSHTPPERTPTALNSTPTADWALGIYEDKALYL